MDIKEYISSGIIELYVMGLCTPEEEKDIEQLRLQYPELREAIILYETEMENRMQQQAALPPAVVDQRILQQLDTLTVSLKDADKDKTVIKKMSPRTTWWWKPAAAASLVLLAFSIYFNYTLYTKNKKLDSLVRKSSGSPLPLSDYQVFTNPAITPVAMYGVGTHSICRCTMFWDKKTGKIYIMIHHLPKSSSTRDYQLWAEVDGKPVSVGIINDEIRGRFIELTDVPGRANAFTVTLEKAGGSNSPTVSETYLAGKI